MKRPSALRGAIGAVLLLAGTFLGAAEADLLRFIPAGVDYLVSVNVEKLLQSKGFESLRRQSDFLQDSISDFEDDYRLKLADCRRVIWVGGGRYIRGVLVETTVSEAALGERLEPLRKKKRFREASLRGKKVFVVKTGESIPTERREIVILYLTPTVVLASENGYLQYFLQGIDAPWQMKERFTSPAGDPLAWGFVSVQRLVQGSKKKNPLQAGLLNGLRSVFGSVDLVGNAGTDLLIQTAADCRDANSAQMLRGNVVNYLAIGSVLVFGDNPDLGAEVLSKIKISPKGNQLVGRALLEEPLLKRLGEYFGTQAAKRMIPPDPIPGTGSAPKPAALPVGPRK